MYAKSFVDTNVLVYAQDVDQKEKHLTARRILRELLSTRSAALSPVLQEFYVTSRAR
jgi:predicted nucleic acid-binding protein